MPGARGRSGAKERPTDEALAALYADGDAEAFGELFRRYESRAYGFFLKRTRSPERAQDLYQELFLRLHRARDGYDPTRPFAPWFFQIAHHLLQDDNRRAHRSHEVPIGGCEHRTDRPGSEEQAAGREHVRRVLDDLSPEERYILVSSKVVGVGYAELACELGKSVDAVKKVASRAIQRLRTASPPHTVPEHVGSVSCAALAPR